MRNNVILIGVLLVVAIALIVLKFEVSLYDEILAFSEPGVKIHREYITVGGSVGVESMYITRAKSELIGRELQVTLKGFNIPMSRIEGEYYFDIKVNNESYDSIVLIGDGENQRLVLYTK